MLDNIQRTTTARPRTGLLFLAVVVGHVILISSQVQSRSGVPVLEGVTFGAFARLQEGTAGAIKSVRNVWGSYVICAASAPRTPTSAAAWRSSRFASRNSARSPSVPAGCSRCST